MRQLTQKNRSGIDVAFTEYDSIEESIEELGKNDVLGLINAGVKRRKFVNTGRKGQNKLLAALRKNPELLAKLEAMAAEMEDDE